MLAFPVARAGQDWKQEKTTSDSEPSKGSEDGMLSPTLPLVMAFSPPTYLGIATLNGFQPSNESRDHLIAR